MNLNTCNTEGFRVLLENIQDHEAQRANKPRSYFHAMRHMLFNFLMTFLLLST